MAEGGLKKPSDTANDIVNSDGKIVSPGPEKKKRGRKRKNALYFGPEQEEAVVRFLASDSNEERTKIFNQYLRHPLNKMVESIIRKYNLYRKDVSFENLHSDTLSFLITKVHKFQPAKGKKAYSYFGTICKHYLLGHIIKDDKRLTQTTSYEDAFPKLETKSEFMYEIDEITDGAALLIKQISEDIKNVLENESVSVNEKLVGDALIDILDNWEVMFDDLNGSKKYTKNSILSTIREITLLQTKDIRKAMVRYKKMYELIKSQHIDDGLL